MENMKSLADQIRQELVNPSAKEIKPEKNSEVKIRTKTKAAIPDILNAILTYDTSENKSMVHVRFDAKTLRIMNQFKMAAGVDVTRLVSFSVKHLFDTCPELKTIIKQFIQNTDL